MDGLGGGRIGRLAGVLFLFAALACPVSADASAGFTFVPDPAQPSLAPGSTVAAVAELEGTSSPDLVLIDDEDDSIGVMIGNGSGGFAAPAWYSLAGRPANDVKVADFNNDGHLDLLVGVETEPPPTPQESTMPNKVQILFGDGQGGFTVGQPIALPEVGFVQAGDFTGNGDQDAVVVPDGCTGGGNDRKYYMLLGDGHGELTPGPVYESPRTGGCGTWVDDFTGDGRDDVLTQSQDPEEEEAIVVLPGEPDGSFGPAIITPTPEFAPYGGAFVSGMGELSGDGRPDLVVRAFSQSTGQVAVLDGNGAGGFTEGGFYPLEQPNTYNFVVALGAFAGDGHVDVAAVGAQWSGPQLTGSLLTVLANNGSGVLSDALTAPLSVFGGGVFAADVNGDGRPDLIINSQSELHIFLDEPMVPSGNESESLPSTPASNALNPSTRAIAPSVQRARESTKSWREGSRLARDSRGGAPVGTTFSFLLNEPATASFSFNQKLAGRKVRGRCVAETAKNRRGGSCRRSVVAGALSFTAHAGANSVVFDGRVSSSRRLTPGAYTLTIRATNFAGSSNAKQLAFTIVR
jgi:FG-GAP-like repeat